MFTPPAYVEKVGTQFPRFICRDGAGQYFTIDGRWVEKFSEGGALFYSEATALAMMNRYSDGEHVRDTFTLQVVVTTDKDSWSIEELVKHLTQFGGFHFEKNNEPRGVIVEVRWNDLRKTGD
ncbi:MAG: hypothetical protein ACLP9L_06710 [Thermoguttaceae bacterium]